MDDETVGPPQRAPAGVIIAVIGAVVLALVMVARMYANPDLRDCMSRYDRAQTAADSAVVDSTAPNPDREITCGLLRGEGSWR